MRRLSRVETRCLTRVQRNILFIFMRQLNSLMDCLMDRIRVTYNISRCGTVNCPKIDQIYEFSNVPIFKFFGGIVNF